MEKLVKSVNALKVYYGDFTAEEKNAKESLQNAKDRQILLNNIADALSSSLKNSADLPGLIGIATETLLQCCADDNADVRLNADECLNKVIKSLHDTAISKILVELYKDIKKNGHARSVRASLNKFASLCSNIRAAKCRVYILNFLPCLIRISQRKEDALQECLAQAVGKIFFVLGAFVSEGEIQGLVASFLKNLSSSSTTHRRTAGICLHAIVANSRKITPVLIPLLHSVLDILAQRHNDRNTILGCLQALRLIAPLLEINIQTKDAKQAAYLALLVKVFESSCFYLCNSDHTIVTSSLELLEQLLKTFPYVLLMILGTRQYLREPSFVPAAVMVPSGGGLQSTVPLTEASSVSNLSSSATNEKKSLLAEDSTDAPEVDSVDTNLASNEHSTGIPDSATTPGSSVVTSRDDDSPVQDSQESISTCDEKTPSSASSASTDDVTKAILRFNDLFHHETRDADCCPSLPINILARMLCQRFLLSSEGEKLLPDSKVRVSTKNLALTCFSCIVKLCPETLLLPLSSLAKDSKDPVDPSTSTSDPHGVCLKDVLLYRNHSDPQLRGMVLIVAGSFINSVLLRQTFRNNADPIPPSAPSIQDLSAMILEALTDESSTTVRQASTAISCCVHALLNSEHFALGVQLVWGVLALHHISYWLVLSDMLEIISTLNFRQLTYLEKLLLAQNPTKPLIKRNTVQEEAIAVVLHCISDEDARVRRAASNALVAMVTRLSVHGAQDEISSDAFHLCRQRVGSSLSSSHNSTSMETDAESISAKSLLKVFRGFRTDEVREGIDESLSYVVSRVGLMLSTSTNKWTKSGALLALKQLSMTYPACGHPAAWGFHFAKYAARNTRERAASNLSTSSRHSSNSLEEDVAHLELGILPTIMDLLETPWLQLDVTTHSDCVIVAGNLLAGASTHEFHVLGCPRAEEPPQGEKTKSSGGTKSWSSIRDRTLSSYAHALFTHLVQLLSISHHVITETTPTSNKSVLPNLPSNPSLPSPIKRKDKQVKDSGSNRGSPNVGRRILPNSPMPKTNGSNKEDVEKEKSNKKSLGSFHQNRILMKLFDQMTGAYRNYKSSLDFGSSDRFCAFVQTILDVLSQVMELATFQDTAHHTEEILGYLKSSFLLEPNSTVQCVQQVLKALFGTNLVSQREPLEDVSSPRSRSSTVSGSDVNAAFYHQIFHHPLNHLTMSIANASYHNSLQVDGRSKDGDGWFGSIKKKMELKLSQASKQAKNSKSSIQNYIRLFEGLVIRSLKTYTITSSVEFQKQVLNLLAQLVQLRVNYCMLDSDQVFITFIIRQFELIEAGMVRDSERLIPHIFFFLVLLSYERYHSKSIITMPKIIQLCDGLMASGQGSISHVIPAMQPVVHDLFVVKSATKQDMTQMTAQREVVQFMMLKLLQFAQVFEMVTTVLQHGRRENAKGWKELSQQIAMIILSQLDNLQINFESYNDICNLHTLFEAVAPSALRPCSQLVRFLFTVPSNLLQEDHLHRWLAKILILLRLIICHFKEADVLSSIGELHLSKSTFSTPNLLHSPQSSEASDGKVPEPQVTMALFFNQVIGITSHSLANFKEPISNSSLMCQELAEILLELTYLHRAGSFKLFTHATRELFSNSTTDRFYSSQQMRELYLSLGNTYPVMALIWCQYLMNTESVHLDTWADFTDLGRKTPNPTINQGIVKRGCLILLADYVFQNEQQSELISWLINSHLYDIIELHREPPVQDLISAVNRSKDCVHFIRALEHLRDRKLKGSFVQKVLRCFEGVKIDYVSNLLRVLIGPQFLFSPLLSIAQVCDRHSRVIVEKLLALSKDFPGQPPIEEVKQWMVELNASDRRKRFSLLRSLLVKLHEHLGGESTQEGDKYSASVEKLMTEPDKDWFKSYLLSCCRDDQWSPECAVALSCADCDDITEIFKHQGFKPSYLETCVAFGVKEALSSSAATPYPEDDDSPIMKAALTVTLQRLHCDVNKLPELKDYKDELSDKFFTSTWIEEVATLCSALVRCFEHDQNLPEQYRFPTAEYEACSALVLHMCQILYWQLNRGETPSLRDTVTTLELLQQLLKFDDVRRSLLGDSTSVMCVTHMMFSLLRSYAGEPLLPKPFLPQSIDVVQSNLILSDPTNPLCCCVRLSQMLHLIRHSSDLIGHESFPRTLIGPFKNVVLHLCTSPLTNSYIRVPALLWKYGWNPPLDGVQACSFPDIPADYLQEKEVLTDFISIVNHIGWTSRTQFEETWATLLGVLVSQSGGDDTDDGGQGDERIEIARLALRGLSSLVIMCSLVPHGGQPATGCYKLFSRHAPLKLSHTSPGRQLLKVRAILHEELSAMLGSSARTHHYYKFIDLSQTFTSQSYKQSNDQDWLTTSIERILTIPTSYGYGQVSVLTFQQLYGIQPFKDEVSVMSSDDDLSTLPSESDPFHDDDSDTSDVFESERQSTSPASEALSPLRIRDGVDVHSCVQFLLDLYTEWFRSAAQPPPGGGIARQVLCECVQSLLLISDLFTERQQFEWMLSALVALRSSQPPEDEVLLQYLVVAICKSAAVLGMTADAAEAAMSILEPSLISNFLPCRVAALHAALYCLERCNNSNTKGIIDLLATNVPGYLVNVSTCKAIYNDEYVAVLTSVAYYVIEKCQDLVTPEFTSIIVQASVLILSSQETVPSRVYHAVALGLERLLLLFALSSAECDNVLKAAAEQLQTNPSLPRATAACAVLLTSMYCERMRVVPRSDTEGSLIDQGDVTESRLLAMERVSLLFERIRRGCARDARVMVRVLPFLLDDFFSSTDLMNKVIAEFISNFQPFPNLVADVLNKVFQTLHSRDQSQLVLEWVMLSLGNVVQRTPLSTAIWCLTCLFACASTNHWINSLLPVITERMNSNDPAKDWDCFCKTAVDFYKCQLTLELDRRSFHSTISSASSNHDVTSPYHLLLDCIKEINGDQGILQ